MPDSIFKNLYLTGLIVGSVIRGLYTRRNREKKTIADRSTPLDALLILLAFFGLLVIPLFYVFTPWLNFADYDLPVWTGWVGGLIFVVALWLLWRSHADLGHNWSPKLEIREGQSLVTQGVFRHIRHPMYAAHWLWGIAQALLLQNWIAGLVFLAVFLPLYQVRVSREEQMLLEHFGKEYRLYMDRTGRIIPRLWG